MAFLLASWACMCDGQQGVLRAWRFSAIWASFASAGLKRNASGSRPSRKCRRMSWAFGPSGSSFTWPCPPAPKQLDADPLLAGGQQRQPLFELHLVLAHQARLPLREVGPPDVVLPGVEHALADGLQGEGAELAGQRVPVQGEYGLQGQL